MDPLASSELHDSCLDLISCNPLTDAVTLVPCGHSFSKETADLLIRRGDECPFDRKSIESYVTSYKIRELVAERMIGGPKEKTEPSLEAITYIKQAREFYNAFNYPQAIDACIKAMNLCPNYPKAQILLESSLLAQAKDSLPSTREISSTSNLQEIDKVEEPALETVTPSAPTLEEVMKYDPSLINPLSNPASEGVKPSAPTLEEVMKPIPLMANPSSKPRLFGKKDTVSTSDFLTRLELLKVRDEEAFDWLIFASYLSYENISEFWLKVLLEEQQNISLAEAQSKARVLLHLLAQFQFITYHETTQSFALHQKLPQKQQTDLLYGHAFSFFQEQGERLRNNSQLAVQRGLEWIQHVEKLLQHSFANKQDSLAKAKIYSLMGFLHQVHLNEVQAVTAFRQCVNIKREGGSNPSLDIAASLSDLGTALFRLGNYEESVTHHQEALKIYSSFYREKPHVATWQALHDIGAALAKTNKCFESLENHRKALEMSRLLPNNRSYILSSLNAVADTAYSFGIEEALKAYQELLQELKKKDTEDREQQIADCYSQIGHCYYYKSSCLEGDLTENALKAYQQSLTLYRSLGSKGLYPDLVKALFNVGCVLFSKRKCREAFAYLQEGLSLKETISQADTSKKDSQMGSFSLLESIFPEEKMQKLNEIEYLEQELLLQDFLWGEKSHPHIANILMKLGYEMWGNNRYNESITYSQQALKMYQDLYKGASHLHSMVSTKCLGMNCSRLDRNQEALAYFTEALIMCYGLYGNNPNSWTAGILTWVPVVLYDLKRVEEGLEFSKKSLSMHQALHEGQPHASIAKAYKGLSMGWQHYGDNTQALNAANQALAMYREIHQEPHLDIVEILHRLGNLHNDLHKEEKAIAFWRQALVVARSLFGGTPNTNLTYWLSCIACAIIHQATEANNLYRKKQPKKYEEAKKLLLEELSIYQILYKDNPHESTALVLSNIGACYYNLYQHSTALSWYMKSLNMRRMLKQDDAHPDMIKLSEKIALAKDNMDSCSVS